MNARAICRVCFENKDKFVRKIIIYFFIIKQIKKAPALTVLCSVIKHPGSGDSTQEVGRNTRLSVRVSPYTSFVLSPLPACFITEQSSSTVEAFLFINYISAVQRLLTFSVLYESEYKAMQGMAREHSVRRFL